MRLGERSSGMLEKGKEPGLFLRSQSKKSLGSNPFLVTVIAHY